MATKQVTIPDLDTVLDVIGCGAIVYLAWVFAGGPPLPVLKDVVPFIAAGAAGVVAWRLLRKNNK